jgi:hypothetical protein
MTRRGSGLKLRIIARRAGRAARKHYVSLASLVVLAAFLVLAMTSDSFVAREAPAPRGQQASESTPPALRHAVVFFVVRDEAQMRAISEAYIADQDARAGGSAHYDQVVYLIAGTADEEASAIARINFETLLLEDSYVDVRVLDVRRRGR